MTISRTTNSARLQQLEERQAERRARSSQRDEAQVVHEATMERICASPSGLESLQAYEAAMQAADGNILEALQSATGRAAVARFGAVFIRAQR